MKFDPWMTSTVTLPSQIRRLMLSIRRRRFWSQPAYRRGLVSVMFRRPPWGRYFMKERARDKVRARAKERSSNDDHRGT